MVVIEITEELQLQFDRVFREELLKKLDERNRYLKVIAKVIDSNWGLGEYEKEFK